MGPWSVAATNGGRRARPGAEQGVGTRALPRRLRPSMGLVVVALLAIVACKPVPPPPVVADAYTVIFIGDAEPRMRGNTDAEVARAVRRLVNLSSTRVAYFAAGGGKQYRIDPKLVILGGDISADRTTSITNDMAIYEPLYRAGIGFIAGFGNHDWESALFQGSHSPVGQLANDATTAFTRETYRRTANLGIGLGYREIGPVASHGPTVFHATFRGVEIANFNTFLYEPSYDYPADSPQGCTAATVGPCPLFRSAEPQLAAMDRLVQARPDRTLLVVQHYPITTYAPFWTDYGATTTTLGQKRGRLLNLLATHPRSALLAGHNHQARKVYHQVGDRLIGEYIAPYFGGNGGDDPAQAGGSYAVLVSPTKGILEVKELRPG